MASRGRSRAGVYACVFAAFALMGCGDEPRARHVQAIPWALGGAWLVGDTHSHTRFSDGALTPAALADLAVANGCRVLAITDHNDGGNRTATPAYFAAIDAERARHPGLVLIAGLEWNVPPHRGREHVNVLVDPAIERDVLTGFRARFEPSGPDPTEALAWLREQDREGARVVLVYNHPSRVALAPEERAAEAARWRSTFAGLAAFEGGPGHQRMAEPGGYRGRKRTIDRWDPIVAEAGGPWDAMLDRGTDIHGALAVSDYHNDEMDLAPCRFSRTHFQVPTRDAAGVLAALKAGSFWAGHGGVLANLGLTLSAPGLDVPASPGETILHAQGASVVARIVVERTVGSRNAALAVELIGNCVGGRPALIGTRELAAGVGEAEWTVGPLAPGADRASCYLRARVRSDHAEFGRLGAYTNAVRIRLAGP